MKHTLKKLLLVFCMWIAAAGAMFFVVLMWPLMRDLQPVMGRVGLLVLGLAALIGFEVTAWPILWDKAKGLW